MDCKTSEWRPGPTVCRCCLSEGCYKDISTEYFWMGKREVYAEMLSDTFNVSIAYSQSGGPNSNSRLICESCISRLRDASEFKRQVQECEKTFTQHLDPGTTIVLEVETMPTGETDKSVKLERIKVERQYSDDEFGDDAHDFPGPDDNDDDDDLDDQPLTHFASKVPKKESIDIQDLLDNSQLTVKRKSVKAKSTPAKKVKVMKKETPVKATASGTTKAVAKSADKKKKGVNEKKIENADCDTESFGEDNDNVKQDSDIYKTAPKTEILKHRNNIKEILLCSNATPIRRYGGVGYTCCYCMAQYPKPQQLKTHTLDVHKDVTQANFMKSMNMSEYVVKLDITSLACKLCNVEIDTLEQLFVHLANVHERIIFSDIKNHIFPFKFDSDVLKCPLCCITFEKFRVMANHMHKHYRNFVCSICDVGFVNRNSYTQHAEKHRTGDFPCQFCKKIFPTLYKKKLHERNKHTHIDMLNKCAYCAETFKDYRKREVHLAVVHGVELSTPKCQSCDKIFSSRRLLSVHVRRDHLMDRPHKCTYCDMRFFSTSGLKNHIVTHTKSKDFSCEVCLKSFGRRKTLSSHKRIHETEKRYKCEHCDQGFVHKSSWRTHMQKKHDVIV